jgi:hypothetical protein
MGREKGGEVHSVLRVSAGVRPGTVSLPKGLWRRNTGNGLTSTALVPDALTDVAGGACFNDTRVQVTSLAQAEHCGSLERLPEAEVRPPLPSLRHPFDRETWDRVDLVAHVESQRPNGRPVSHTTANRIPQTGHLEEPVLGPHVSTVDKQDASQSAERFPHFGAERQQRVASHRKTGFRERAHLEPTPSADTGCTTEEIPFGERHVRWIVVGGLDRGALDSIGEDEPATNRMIVSNINRDRRVLE